MDEVFSQSDRDPGFLSSPGVVGRVEPPESEDDPDQGFFGPRLEVPLVPPLGRHTWSSGRNPSRTNSSSYQENPREGLSSGGRVPFSL